MRPIPESSSCLDKRTRMAMTQRSDYGPAPTTSLNPVASRDVSYGCPPLPICLYRGNRHRADCRKMKGACFRCGSLDHFLRDCPHPSSVVCTPAQTSARSQAYVHAPVRSHSQNRAPGSASRPDSGARSTQN
ncbi:hypothetical protein V6N12_036101 [Hibiscus sabdariffa]|uniref:CCHC-type domain-containing protein n=1 Tax=Hibiscus sabdariffa TaxID=183260 RepID=A0ABR2EPN3_9ROSI